MATIYHPTHSSGKVSPAWNIACYLPAQKKHHYVRLVYPDGTRVCNEREAWQFCREHQATCREAATPPGTHTVSSTLTAYLAATQPERQPASHAKLVAYAARWQALLGPVPLTQLDRAQIQQALATLLTTPRTLRGQTYPPMTKVTRDHYLALLRAACRWACIVQKWLPGDPTVGIKKDGKSPTRVHLPQERWADFLDLARTSTWYEGTAMGLLLGLRAGEIVQQLPTDFRLGKQLYQVRAEVAKNGVGETRPFLKEFGPILQPLLDRTPPGQPLCPYDYWRWQEAVQRWLKTLGYRGKNLGIHTLRHSFCTWAYEALGKEAAAWLCRHKSIQTTERYLHSDKVLVRPEQMTVDALRGCSTHLSVGERTIGKRL